MAEKITRRVVVMSVATSAALLPQTTAPALPPALPSSPDEELKAARDQLRAGAEQLAKFALPMSAEPATHFKV